MKKVTPIFLVLALLLILYLFFPTANSSMDAYGYAAEIKLGKNFFQPFHLLYNALGYTIYRLTSFFIAVDVLSMMKALNAVVAVVCLFFLYKILDRLISEQWKKILLVLCCGLSFAVWRFATENETYIIPVAFSLIASLAYLKFQETRSDKYVLLTGFIAAIACLFHVIHFFWWVGLAVGVIRYKDLKQLTLYLVASLICPAVYLLVIRFYIHHELSFQGIWSFFSPTLSGNSVQYHVSPENLYLGFISSFRTFYQVHGTTFLLLKKYSFLIIPALVSVLLAAIALFYLIKRKGSVIEANFSFIKLHKLIFILQLLWAFYSKGNAEFMVMLPFLLAIGFGSYADRRALSYLCVSLFIWNFTLGILPGHYADFSKREKLLAMIQQKKDAVFIVERYGEVVNQLFYATGIEMHPRVRPLPEKRQQLLELAKDLRANKQFLYTDFSDKPKVTDRYTLTQSADYSFMHELKYVKVDSFVNFYGKNFIYKIIF